MSMESFKILKEINSLSQKKSELEASILKEEKRLDFIKKNREDRSHEKEDLNTLLKQFKSELMETENTISQLSSKIEKDKSNLSSLIDGNAITSLQKQIDDMKTNLDLNEEKGLELLEEIEETESKISDCVEFLTGSLESLNEIGQEVQLATRDYTEEIEILNNRNKALMEQLPENFKSRIELTLQKEIKISNFTRIKSDTCEFCRFNLSKIDIIAIEDKLALKSCQGCSRIFIPIQAGY